MAIHDKDLIQVGASLNHDLSLLLPGLLRQKPENRPEIPVRLAQLGVFRLAPC